MYNKEKVISFLREHYPYEDTETLCLQLGLSKSAVWTLATRNGIHKNGEYLNRLHNQLMKKKEEKYLASIPDISLNQIERNIIVGSILGDGSIAFSNRSRNAYYREHFSLKQKQYREWKMKNINSLRFRIEGQEYLKSPSHPIFTDLYNSFFVNGSKTITTDNIKSLDHPIGLACFYMDDGTLMISASKAKKAIRIHPAIGITTLCFSKTECEILVNHIAEVFDINFYLSSHPHGKGWTIKISSLDQINRFFNLIMPYCKEVPCLKYKWDLSSRLEQKRQELIRKYYKFYNINISSTNNTPNYYSLEDEEKICEMKTAGKTYREIAISTGRTYDAISYKIHYLRKQGKL